MSPKTKKPHRLPESVTEFVAGWRRRNIPEAFNFLTLLCEKKMLFRVQAWPGRHDKLCNLQPAPVQGTRKNETSNRVAVEMWRHVLKKNIY